MLLSLMLWDSNNDFPLFAVSSFAVISTGSLCSSFYISPFPRPFFFESDLCSIYTWFIYEPHTDTDKSVPQTHTHPFIWGLWMGEFGQPTLCIILFLAYGLFLIIDFAFLCEQRQQTKYRNWKKCLFLFFKFTFLETGFWRYFMGNLIWFRNKC